MHPRRWGTEALGRETGSAGRLRELPDLPAGAGAAPNGGSFHSADLNGQFIGGLGNFDFQTRGGVIGEPRFDRIAVVVLDFGHRIGDQELDHDRVVPASDRSIVHLVGPQHKPAVASDLASSVQRMMLRAEFDEARPYRFAIVKYDLTSSGIGGDATRSATEAVNQHDGCKRDPGQAKQAEAVAIVAIGSKRLATMHAASPRLLTRSVSAVT